MGGGTEGAEGIGAAWGTSVAAGWGWRCSFWWWDFSHPRPKPRTGGWLHPERLRGGATSVAGMWGSG